LHAEVLHTINNVQLTSEETISRDFSGDARHDSFSRSLKKVINFYLAPDVVPSSNPILPAINPVDLRVDLKCPSCNGVKIFHDSGRGEIICMDCGNIVDHHSIDTRGVRVYDRDDVENKVHYEPLKPENRVIVKFKSRDPDSRRRERENNRILWEQKKVMTMNIELGKLKGVLPISKRLHDMAMEEVKKVFMTDILRGRNAILVGMAVLYYATIKCNSPIGLNDIIKAVSTSVEEERKVRRAIRSAIQVLSKRLGYKFVPKKDHANLLSMVSSDLNIPQNITTRAIKMFKAFKENNVISGDPKGYAGACLYFSCKMETGFDDAKTQVDIARAIEMTDVTIRKRAKELKSFFDRVAVVW
jgi:transcription initiation factor TFIIB